MPSKAYKHFRVNMIDVQRLIESHTELSPTHQGKRALGHLTRSGVVMLCACWELYTESLLIESARYLANKFYSPDSLPLEVKKHISKQVKEARHELKPLELAGFGWRSVYDAFCCNEVKSLNTPKPSNLKPLFNNYLGVPDLTTMWSCPQQSISDFVSLRGDIAHNGRFTEYVTIGQLKGYSQLIYTSCKEMDSAICDYLLLLVGGNIQPWRKASK
jgi:RiboL-PSP-HEPN